MELITSAHDDMDATNRRGAHEFSETHDEAVEGSRAPPIREASKNHKKKIVEIDVDQARQIIGNISPRSIKTLRKFMYGDWVSIESLVGEGNDYRDLVELKKSLVGGVTRRLRSVIGDRDAELFSSNTDKSSLRIGSTSAASLELVLFELEAQFDPVLKLDPELYEESDNLLDD